MITKFPIEDVFLISDVNEKYGVEVISIQFIPLGDSAYSYRVDCLDGQKFFLKLFDHQNERQRKGIMRLSYYLPLTWQLYHEGILRNITYPIKNEIGEYSTTLDGFTIVLFNFIEGETLADAHPFSDALLKEVAESMAIFQRITPMVDLTTLPKDSFNISFVASLKKCLKELEAHPKDNSTFRTLREFIFPLQSQILTSIDLVTELRDKIIRESMEFVLCHGDIWGGNMIRQGQLLHFIDWESVIVAPLEHNFFSFLGDGFNVFYTAYEEQLNQPIKLNLDLLRFYSYRTHLRNLTQWLINILHGNNTQAQDDNDLDMIRNHCLNRLDPIETNLHRVEIYLKKKDKIKGSFNSKT